MAVKFKCKCGVMYRVPDEKYGRELRCKKCNHVMIVSATRGKTKVESKQKDARRVEADDAEPIDDVEVVDDWALLPDDEFSVLGDDGLPPVVVGRKEKKPAADPARRKKRRGPAEPASEFSAPLFVAFVGLGLTVATSLLLRPEGIPAGIWLGLRLALVAVSLVITFAALFVASMVVEADYGYISTGIIKVTAIVLTQDWVGDLASRIPVPFVGSILAFATTYGMFKYFFGLDDTEAIASMFVVRMVHWVVFSIVFVALIGFVLAGNNIELPAGWGDVAPAIEGPADGEIGEDEEGIIMEPDGAEP